MTKLFAGCLNRLLRLGLASAAAMMLLAPAAQATPYVVKFVQQGSNVVATGSGAFDMTGLVFSTLYGSGTSMRPNVGYASTGALDSVLLDAYTGFTGPTSFGVGGLQAPASGSGDYVGIIGTSATYGSSLIFLPAGYVSGSALSGTVSFDNASFASLGVTPGIYVWMWGTGADQSFTLEIGNALDVPEPATLGLFGVGLLLLGAFAGRRRRRMS
jgi:hypothetical protein